MDLEKLIPLLLVPTALLTFVMQFLKQIAWFGKYAWGILIPAVLLGPVMVWLFSELTNLGDQSIKNIVALGLLVGAASIGGFEILKRVPGVNNVVK